METGGEKAKIKVRMIENKSVDYKRLGVLLDRRKGLRTQRILFLGLGGLQSS